jgi:Amt family ammonium transporter
LTDKTSSSAFQQQNLVTETSSIASGVDTFYLLFAGALVYFMQTGFAMLCAGSIRAKNVQNVILWNLLDSCGGGLAFWAVGYAFAYGGDDDGDPTFIGNEGFFLANGKIDFESWFFQFAFACALSSIVAGTIAERTQMVSFITAILLFVWAKVQPPDSWSCIFLHFDLFSSTVIYFL